MRSKLALPGGRSKADFIPKSCKHLRGVVIVGSFNRNFGRWSSTRWSGGCRCGGSGAATPALHLGGASSSHALGVVRQEDEELRSPCW